MIIRLVFLQEGIFYAIGKDFTIFKTTLNDGELRNIFIHDTRDTDKPNTLISKEGYVIKKQQKETKILLKEKWQSAIFITGEKKTFNTLF